MRKFAAVAAVLLGTVAAGGDVERLVAQIAALHAAARAAAQASTRRTAAPTRRYGPAVTGRPGATRSHAAARSRPNAGAARYRRER